MLDLSSPIKSSIILYIFLIIMVLIYKPKLLKDNCHSQCLLSIVVIVLSIVSYYSLITLRWIKGV